MATFLTSRGSQIRCLVNQMRQFTLKPVLKRSLNTSIYPTYQASQRLTSLKIFARNYGHKAPLTYDFARDRVLLVLRLYDKIDPQKLTLESHFMNDLGLDSLDHIDVIMALEDEFQCEIPEKDAEKLLRPIDIVRYITDKEEAYEGLQGDH